jgi:aminopeptidase N
VLSNAGSGGFYRTAYDPETLHALTEVFPSLEPAERAGLLGDLWALSRAGKSDVGRVLDVIARLGDEPNPVVLARASGVLRVLDDGIVPAELKPRFHAWVDDIFRSRLEVLGVEGSRREEDERRMARAVVVDVLGDLVRDPTVRDTMEDAGRRAIVSPRSIDPELFPVALRIAARRGDAALFERLDKQRRRAATPQLERQLLVARADFEDPTLVRHLLEETLTEAVRSQDLAFVYTRLLQNPAARWHAWHFLKQCFEPINQRAVTYMWKRIADAMPALGTAEGLREVRAFFAKHPLPDTDQGMKQALEWMTLDLAFRRRARTQAMHWLTARTPGARD